MPHWTSLCQKCIEKLILGTSKLHGLKRNAEGDLKFVELEKLCCSCNKCKLMGLPVGGWGVEGSRGRCD
jgi:hypothetical protein